MILGSVSFWNGSGVFRVVHKVVIARSDGRTFLKKNAQPFHGPLDVLLKAEESNNALLNVANLKVLLASNDFNAGSISELHAPAASVLE